MAKASEDEPEEKLLSRLRRAVFQAGVFHECRRRSFFESSHDKKKRKARDASQRNRKRRPQPEVSAQEETPKKKDDEEDDNWELPEVSLLVFYGDLFESQAAVAREATKFLLIEKILSDKPVNRKGAMGVLHSMWASRDCPVITELGSQTYGLAFNSKDLMLQAMIDCHWNVMGFCLILKKWEVEKSIVEIPFDKVQYWIQIHGLPLEMQNLNNLKKIGSNIGSVTVLKKPEWNPGNGRCYMRARIEIDARKPLLPGFWVPRLGKDRIWVKLKYEKLGDFCFACGKLGHSMKNCDINVSDLPRDSVYGPWLKAALLHSTMDDRMIFVEEHGVPELPMVGPVIEDGKLVHYPPDMESVERSALDRTVMRDSVPPFENSTSLVHGDLSVGPSQARGGKLGDDQGARGLGLALGNRTQASRRVGSDFEASGSCSRSVKVASEENCVGMDWVLKAYCDVSGKMVNLQKSSIVFGLNVETIIFLAERAALEFKNAKEYRDALVKCRKKAKPAAHWEPPEAGNLKLNYDGAYEESTGMAAIGVVLRDEHGFIKGGIAKQVSVSSSIEAGALAVKEAALFARNQSLNRVTIETDAEMVQKSLSKTIQRKEFETGKSCPLSKISKLLWIFSSFLL
ncbi:Ribosomal protein S21 [Corchorus olitorius]|uniref:Ribosomal protein S21 n=1 Tax=Corchorus olitorius TaxID=93759 RepID=A0A1R3KCS6_9ROSI|nr:Ribosomal protein S21 [Corchorus olitorius]